MRIVLIADVFPPLCSSGAIQLRDLSLEFIRQNHQITVLIPSSEIDQPWLLEDFNGVEVMRLKAPKTKDTNYVRRTFGEFLMPFVMLRNFRKSPLAKVKWGGVVWYSPSIFLGPIVKALKKTSGCHSYLIIRDIFPEWAVDMGLMGRGLPYRFFKAVEKFQYSIADVIGVQTPANVPYFDVWRSRQNGRVEVLQNWLAYATNMGCSISVAASSLAGRTIFVYAGNMGVAQGMDILLDLAERMLGHTNVGFIFVGRGSATIRLREESFERGLSNVVFYDEIAPSEIPGLYAQCHVGIVALDPRHKTHNIPGKFLSYMQSGMPVLACINPGNDLEDLIVREGVGRVCTDHSVDTLQCMAVELVEVIASGEKVSRQCLELSTKLFSPEAAVKQIVVSLECESSI